MDIKAFVIIGFIFASWVVAYIYKDAISNAYHITGSQVAKRGEHGSFSFHGEVVTDLSTLIKLHGDALRLENGVEGNVKDEFETTSQYNSRIAEAAKVKKYKAKFFDEPVLMILPESRVSYSADTASYIINNPINQLSRSRLGLFLASEIDSDGDSYMASNAYGVEVRVVRYTATTAYLFAKASNNSTLNLNNIKQVSAKFPIELAKKNKGCLFSVYAKFIPLRDKIETDSDFTYADINTKADKTVSTLRIHGELKSLVIGCEIEGEHLVVAEYV